MANRIAVHHMDTKHKIDWEGATCMEFNAFEDERMFLESWFTKCDENFPCRNKTCEIQSQSVCKITVLEFLYPGIR